MAGGGRDFTIDLRMRADFDAARKALRDTEKSLESVATTARDTAAEVSASTSGGGNAQGQRQDLVAQQAWLAASQATQESISAQIGMIGELHDRLDRGASSWEDLADTEAMLDKAMAKGLVTAEEYDEALGKLDKTHGQLQRSTDQQGKAMDGVMARYDRAGAQLQRLARDEAELKKAVDAGRISREQYNKAMAGVQAQRNQINALSQQSAAMRRLNMESAGTQRNLSQLATYALSGNWKMAGNQVLQLGNQAGIATTLLSGMGVAVAGAAAALVAFGIAQVQSYQEMRAHEKALVATGNAAGVTAGELEEAAQRVGKLAGNYDTARQAADLLVRSGKTSADTLQDMIQAAVSLANLTGDSIEQTTAKITALADAPARQLQELNKQYNFLSVSVLEHIRTLEAQGQQTDAVREAIRAMADMSAGRVQDMVNSAGTLERAWGSVKKAVADTWQMIKDVGREDPEYRIRELETFLSENEGKSQPGAQKRADRMVSAARAELAKLKQDQQELTDGAKVLGQIAADNQRVMDLQSNIDRSDVVDKETQRLRERNAVVAEYNELAARTADQDKRLYDGSQERRLAAIDAKYNERPASRSGGGGKSLAEQAEEAAQRELDNLQRKVAMLGELEGAENKVSEAARIRYEIEAGALKAAREGTKAQLVDWAQVADHEQRRIDAARQMVSVQMELAQLQGRGGSVELEQQNLKLRELLQTMEGAGKTAEAADISKLLNLRQASADLEDLQREYSRVMEALGIAQQRIQLGVQSGAITEADAQRQIAALYKEKLVLLDELVPKMEAAAIALGTPEALAAVQRVKLELDGMRQNVDLLQQTVASTFEGAFANALTTLATGTASFGEAVRGFLSDMAAGMARFAAEQLAAMARAKMMAALQKLAGGGEQGGVEKGAAELTVAAAATAGAGVVIQTAATQLQAAATTLMMANAMSSAGGGFSGGGYTGPGGKYQVAGVVHRGEGVLNQAEIGALGGVSGFYALRRAIAAGEARFGHIAPPRVSRAPVFQFAEGGYAGQAMAGPSVEILNFTDIDQLAQRLARSDPMRKAIINTTIEEGGSIQSGWQA